MSFIQVRGEGGYADSRRARDEKLFNVYNLVKEPPRSVDSGLFLRWVHKHMHPRYLSVNVKVEKSNQDARDLLGLPRVGTMYFATTLGRDWHVRPIPRGILPYQNIVIATWDPVRLRWTGDSEQARGWNPIMKDLAKEGFLRPSKALTYLLGEDSYALVPTYLHL